MFLKFFNKFLHLNFTIVFFIFAIDRFTKEFVLFLSEKVHKIFCLRQLFKYKFDME